jgi:hypothetical protein
MCPMVIVTEGSPASPAWPGSSARAAIGWGPGCSRRCSRPAARDAPGLLEAARVRRDGGTGSSGASPSPDGMSSSPGPAVTGQRLCCGGLSGTRNASGRSDISPAASARGVTGSEGSASGVGSSGDRAPRGAAAGGRRPGGDAPGGRAAGGDASGGRAAGGSAAGGGASGAGSPAGARTPARGTKRGRMTGSSEDCGSRLRWIIRASTLLAGWLVSGALALCSLLMCPPAPGRPRGAAGSAA